MEVFIIIKFFAGVAIVFLTGFVIARIIEIIFHVELKQKK
jgi:uncharacterized membrane protein YciS (DUF1049 family)